MMKMILLIGAAATGVIAMQTGVDVSGIPMPLIWFGLATTGIVFALAKI